MDPLSHRRRILLFFVAVLLPSIVLVVLSLRMISQEDELAKNRAGERRERVVSDLGRQLLVRLKRIKLDVAQAHAQGQDLQFLPPDHPSVVIVGIVEARKLALPWDKAESDGLLHTNEAFRRKIQDGENAEFIRKRMGDARGLYNQALESADDPAQRAYARLMLARVLAKDGQVGKGQEHYRTLLRLSPDFQDEHGVPFSFYAAGRLVDDRTAISEIVNVLDVSLTSSRWLAPSAAYMLGGIVDILAETAHVDSLRQQILDLQQRSRKHLRELDKVLILQSDFSDLLLFARLRFHADNTEPLWMLYGDDPWLVSVDSSLSGMPPMAIVVRIEDVWTSMVEEEAWSTNLPGEPTLHTRENERGSPLGSSFPDLNVAFAATGDHTQPSWSLQYTYYLVALVLVLSITLFGAYLLWRDVQRELNLASMRSHFVASVSHELKTPLTAIRMFAETLRLGRTTNPEEREEFLGTIVSESERLTRLLNNVLDFSQIEEGKKRYNSAPTSLGEVVQAAARAMRYPLSQEGFELSVDIADDLPLVSVDRDAIEQAILNLLANALKYSGEERNINLQLVRQNGEALIRVTDGGIGVDPKDQPHIFEKFYRADTPENESLSGTGLGLALVDHIARAHGGRVDVESTLGQGSTFSIHLPLEPHL